MKPSKEQIADAIKELALPWGRVELLCDDYRITLTVVRRKELTYRIMTYVNGAFDSKWIRAKEAHPEQKFLRKSVRLVCSAQRKARDEKALGKRFVSKDPWYSATLTLYMPDWASGKAALSHLCKVCDSVQVVLTADQLTAES